MRLQSCESIAVDGRHSCEPEHLSSAHQYQSLAIMHRHQGLQVQSLLVFLPCTWAIHASLETSDSKLENFTGKNRIVWFSTVFENLRGDISKMERSMDRIAEGLETLETRWAHDLDEKQYDQQNSTNYLNMKLLKEKLERIARVQEQNSRMINLQMSSLTNLEESFNRLENLHSIAINSNEDNNHSKLTFYQQQVVNHLISIDQKLDKFLLGESKTEKGEDKGKEIGKKADESLADVEKNYGDDYESLSSDSSANANGKVSQGCESLRNSGLPSGIYLVDKTLKATRMIWGNTSKIYCDLITDGGGWTIIQRRGVTHEGVKINFTRSWYDYANGFGNLKGDFWLGNDVIHRMTSYDDQYELRIELEDWDGQTAWAQYSDFELGTKMDGYRIRVASYMGNATDSLSAHDSTPFSTFDRRNDLAPRCCPCTADYGGGWWYYSCFEANLNGDYYERNQYRQPFRGIIWEHWRGDYSLKSTKMMIRSKYHNSMNQT